MVIETLRLEMFKRYAVHPPIKMPSLASFIVAGGGRLKFAPNKSALLHQYSTVRMLVKP